MNPKKILSAILFSLIASFDAIAQLAKPLGEDSFKLSSNDLSIEVLKNILGDGLFGGATGVTSLNEQILSNAFTFFNSGMLIFGSILFAYASIMGTIKTATDGEILGKKWNAIWVPVRFSMGTALLFPTIKGYSIAQMAVIFVASQGIGVASAVWNGALVSFTNGGVGLVKPENVSDSIARSFALNIFKSELCIADFNSRRSVDDSKYVFHNNWTSRYTFSWGPENSINPFSKQVSENNCGQIVIPKSIFWGVSPAMSVAQKQSIETIQSQYERSKLPERIAKRFTKAADGSIIATPGDTQVSQAEFTAVIENAVKSYKEKMGPASKTVAKEYTNANADFITSSKEQGWITAGTWYFQLARVSSDLAEATKFTGNFKSPKRGGADGISNDVDQVFSQLSAQYMTDKAINDKTTIVNSSGGTANKVDPGKTSGLWGWMRGIGGATQASAEYLGYDIDNKAHPIVQLKSVGDYMMGSIEAAYGITTQVSTDGVFDRALGKIKENTTGGSNGESRFLKLLDPLFYIATASVITLFIFACGLSLYLPLIPFIIWMGSVLGWLTSIFEAMVAVPVWIAAHLHPEGDDMAGKYGANGYMLILEVFARPVLMIFGLLGSFVICEPFMRMVTSAFWNAAGSVQADSLHGLVSLVVIVCIFVTLCTTFMHRIFALIHLVPNSVMRWVGGNQSGHDKSEQDESKIESAVSRSSSSMGGSMNQADSQIKRSLASGDSNNSKPGS